MKNNHHSGHRTCGKTSRQQRAERIGGNGSDLKRNGGSVDESAHFTLFAEATNAIESCLKDCDSIYVPVTKKDQRQVQQWYRNRKQHMVGDDQQPVSGPSPSRGPHYRRSLSTTRLGDGEIETSLSFQSENPQMRSSSNSSRGALGTRAISSTSFAASSASSASTISSSVSDLLRKLGLAYCPDKHRALLGVGGTFGSTVYRVYARTALIPPPPPSRTFQMANPTNSATRGAQKQFSPLPLNNNLRSNAVGKIHSQNDATRIESDLDNVGGPSSTFILMGNKSSLCTLDTQQDHLANQQHQSEPPHPHFPLWFEAVRCSGKMGHLLSPTQSQTLSPFSSKASPPFGNRELLATRSGRKLPFANNVEEEGNLYSYKYNEEEEQCGREKENKESRGGPQTKSSCGRRRRLEVEIQESARSPLPVSENKDGEYANDGIHVPEEIGDIFISSSKNNNTQATRKDRHETLNKEFNNVRNTTTSDRSLYAYQTAKTFNKEAEAENGAAFCDRQASRLIRPLICIGHSEGGHELLRDSGAAGDEHYKEKKEEVGQNQEPKEQVRQHNSEDGYSRRELSPLRAIPFPSPSSPPYGALHTLVTPEGLPYHHSNEQFCSPSPTSPSRSRFSPNIANLLLATSASLSPCSPLLQSLPHPSKIVDITKINSSSGGGGGAHVYTTSSMSSASSPVRSMCTQIGTASPRSEKFPVVMLPSVACERQEKKIAYALEDNGATRSSMSATDKTCLMLEAKAAAAAAAEVAVEPPGSYRASNSKKCEPEENKSLAVSPKHNLPNTHTHKEYTMSEGHQIVYPSASLFPSIPLQCPSRMIPCPPPFLLNSPPPPPTMDNTVHPSVDDRSLLRTNVEVSSPPSRVPALSTQSRLCPNMTGFECAFAIKVIDKKAFAERIVKNSIDAASKSRREAHSTREGSRGGSIVERANARHSAADSSDKKQFLQRRGSRSSNRYQRRHSRGQEIPHGGNSSPFSMPVYKYGRSSSSLVLPTQAPELDTTLLDRLATEIDIGKKVTSPYVNAVLGVFHSEDDILLLLELFDTSKLPCLPRRFAISSILSMSSLASCAPSDSPSSLPSPYLSEGGGGGPSSPAVFRIPLLQQAHHPSSSVFLSPPSPGGGMNDNARPVPYPTVSVVTYPTSSGPHCPPGISRREKSKGVGEGKKDASSTQYYGREFVEGRYVYKNTAAILSAAVRGKPTPPPPPPTPAPAIHAVPLTAADVPKAASYATEHGAKKEHDDDGPSFEPLKSLQSIGSPPERQHSFSSVGDRGKQPSHTAAISSSSSSAAAVAGAAAAAPNSLMTTMTSSEYSGGGNRGGVGVRSVEGERPPALPIQPFAERLAHYLATFYPKRLGEVGHYTRLFEEDVAASASRSAKVAAAAARAGALEATGGADEVFFDFVGEENKLPSSTGGFSMVGVGSNSSDNYGDGGRDVVVSASSADSPSASSPKRFASLGANLELYRTKSDAWMRTITSASARLDREVPSRGSLLTLLRSVGRVPFEKAAIIVRQVLQGIKYLHCDLGTAHTNLTLKNILFCEERDVRPLFRIQRTQPDGGGRVLFVRSSSLSDTAEPLVSDTGGVAGGSGQASSVSVFDRVRASASFGPMSFASRTATAAVSQQNTSTQINRAHITDGQLRGSSPMPAKKLTDAEEDGEEDRHERRSVGKIERQQVPRRERANTVSSFPIRKPQTLKDYCEKEAERQRRLSDPNALTGTFIVDNSNKLNNDHITIGISAATKVMENESNGNTFINDADDDGGKATPNSAGADRPPPADLIGVEVTEQISIQIVGYDKAVRSCATPPHDITRRLADDENRKVMVRKDGESKGNLPFNSNPTGSKRRRHSVSASAGRGREKEAADIFTIGLLFFILVHGPSHPLRREGSGGDNVFHDGEGEGVEGCSEEADSEGMSLLSLTTMSSLRSAPARSNTNNNQGGGRVHDNGATASGSSRSTQEEKEVGEDGEGEVEVQEDLCNSRDHLSIRRVDSSPSTASFSSCHRHRRRPPHQSDGGKLLRFDRRLCPPECEALILRMVSKNPSDRPTAAECLENPSFLIATDNINTITNNNNNDKCSANNSNSIPSSTDHAPFSPPNAFVYQAYI